MKADSDPRGWPGVAAALATLSLLLLTVQDVSITWDEPIYIEAAERSARWLALIARGQIDQAFEPYTFGISWGLVNEAPPLMRVLHGLGWIFSRHWLPLPAAHRFSSLLMAGLTVGSVVAMTQRRRGLAAGLYAGTALISMPRLFFHMHLAALDFPMAAIWILGTLHFFHLMEESGSAAGRRLLLHSCLLGVWLALALLTKINGILLVPYWGLCTLLLWGSRRHMAVYIFSLPVGLVLLVAGWPWIWSDPWQGLQNWIAFFQQHFGIGQWFAGNFYVDSPWYLASALILLTTPALVLALAIIGVWPRVRPRPSSLAWGPIPVDRWKGLHLIGLGTVLLYFGLPLTDIHDQERMLLPVLMHVAVLSGDGFTRLLTWMRQRHVGFSLPVPQLLLGGLLLTPGMVQTVGLHPHQLAYYSEWIGGSWGAGERKMETIYFASTYAYFLPWLNELPPQSKLWVMPNSWDVLFYYQRYGLLQSELVLLRPSGWGSFYDDAGTNYAVGSLAEADYALIEQRQSGFYRVMPGNEGQLAWIDTRPMVAELRAGSIRLAALYARE